MVKKLLTCLLLFTATVVYPYVSASTNDNNEFKEITIDSKDAKLFCRTTGKGEPLIVLHGGPGLTQDYLLPQMYKLADNNFVIFYDQRGCGKSTGEINTSTINIPTFISDIEAIRQAFHLDKISILGHSWGGFVAMNYAIAHPEHTDKLILANSMPASSEEFYLFISEWTHRITPYQKEIDSIKNTKEFKEGNSGVIEHYYQVIFQAYCYVPEKTKDLNLKMTPLASVNGAKVYEIIRQTIFENSFDLYAQLRKLKVPTLVIHGDFDPIPAHTAQNIHENIQESKYVLMKQCGHFPYVEQPDEFFNHLKIFLIN